MKNILITLLAIIASIFQLSAQNTAYRISGTLEDWQATKASILQWNGEGTRYHDVVVDGKTFYYEGECDYPMVVRINHDDKRTMKSSGGGYYPTKSMHIWAVVCPGANITVDGKVTDYVQAYSLSDAENLALSRIHRQVFPLLNESLNLMVKLELDNTMSEEESTAMSERSRDLSRQAIGLQKRLIEEDPSSVAALWYLDDMLIRSQITPNEVEKILANVSPEYNDHPYYITAKTKAEGAKAAVVGKIVPDIVSNLTPNGETFDLKSLRGKYVIIDFWGTWCGPCMNGMPKMREYRDRYEDKLQIVGVANDNNMDLWRSTIESAKLTWPHIFNGKDDQNFVAKFNVAGYPTKLIVGPDGKILYRASGESEEFYTKLDQLLNE